MPCIMQTTPIKWEYQHNASLVSRNEWEKLEPHLHFEAVPYCCLVCFEENGYS